MLNRKQVRRASKLLEDLDILQHKLKQWQAVSPHRVQITSSSEPTDDLGKIDVSAYLDVSQELGANMIEIATAQLKGQIAEIAGELRKLDVDYTEAA